uniref:Plastid lipid-associated protein/fibrillin conserved domain-containing protein n=1 Tax=Pseudo-nitzschia australis TaxID=44445 RepID=A0A7S4AHN2_9STRA|mmetsp:Transcript_20033/g.43568  ORF Transcript_20033/g.43568 Transcript_20033/m.43568 type:complete len:379 (+) Transcript_20033:243-1379(+)
MQPSSSGRRRRHGQHGKDLSCWLCLLLLFLVAASDLVTESRAWATGAGTMKSRSSFAIGAASTTTMATDDDSWFSSPESNTEATSTSTTSTSIDQLKIQLLQLGAALDRGQAYNPTSGAYYEENMNVARDKINRLLDIAAADTTDDSSASQYLPKSLKDIEGEWELVLSTVPHGIFRSSPFFLAIQEAYEFAETKTFEDGTSKPGLFFKLHELQTCSWGASKVGRIAQHIDASSNYLYSTFDTSLFSLTVIPVLGWFKLLPTFGGCVVTAATATINTNDDDDDDLFMDRRVSRLDMVVDYTTSRKIDGLNGLPLLGDIIWKINVPVGAIWKLLPWNKGREATCKVYVNYFDRDFRIVQDIDGEFFVYTRPVVPRPLEI